MQTVLDYKCPNCGGKVEFESGIQQMQCPYCDSTFDVESLKEMDRVLQNETEQEEMKWNTAGEEWSEDEAAQMQVFVCNSCEEGLGNLKGTKQIFSEYEGRISQFVSFDSLFGKIATRCVGSHRYEVQVTTEGGHSYQAFGNKNAIAELSRIVDEIYKIEVPKKEGTRTSYNVGMISGGTSVNTIAQNAEMLCEYRSNDVECLSFMKKKFEEIFENAKKDDVGVSVKLIGERPCMKGVDEEKIEEMFQKCKKITEEVIGREVISALSSTDCNIPLSLGIPAICIAVCEGDGIHTREEWLKKSSLPQGLEVGIKSIIALLKGEAK